MKKVISGLAAASAAAYLFILYFMLFSGFGRGMVVMSESMLENFNYWNSVNLIPFKTIGEYAAAIANGSIQGHALRNLLGNLLLFFPAGFYMPFFARKARNIKTYSLLMAAAILMVEITQLLTKSGSLDVDDFILNFAGALIGFIVFTRTPARRLLSFRAW